MRANTYGKRAHLSGKATRTPGKKVHTNGKDACIVGRGGIPGFELGQPVRSVTPYNSVKEPQFEPTLIDSPL